MASTTSNASLIRSVSLPPYILAVARYPSREADERLLMAAGSIWMCRSAIQESWLFLAIRETQRGLVAKH
jgi:hypothetical protein